MMKLPPENTTDSLLFTQPKKAKHKKLPIGLSFFKKIINNLSLYL